jgi:hypothetical protein
MGLSSPIKYSSGYQTKPVTLSKFLAQWVTSGGVQLLWRTESEWDNRGWKLYRCTTEHGVYELIHQQTKNSTEQTTTHATDYSYTDVDAEAGGTYFYKLADVDLQGVETVHGPIPVGGGINQPSLETGVVLYQNAPHPIKMGNRTTFRYFIPAKELASQWEPVVINIYNLSGQHMVTLKDQLPMVGLNERLVWNGRDQNGKMITEGIYTYTMQVNGRTYTQRLIIVK